MKLTSVTDSLAQCAEQELDLTDAVYEHFFNQCPEALPLMGHSDQHMRGRMLAQVLEMFLEEPNDENSGYLGWEVNNHVQAYAVKPEMYAPFLAALQQAVSQGLGSLWNPTLEQAWQQQISHMLAVVHQHSSQSSPP